MFLWVSAGIGALVFGLDMILKQAIEEHFFLGEEREVTGSKILLRKIYNKGAAFGLLKGHPDILKKISAAVGGAALLYDVGLFRQRRRFLRKIGAALFTGGACSNIFDRLARGRVIDYIGFRTKWPRLSAITYNLGDFAIFAGGILVSVSRIFSRGRRTPSPGRE